jgi:hypothetical protein
MEGLSALARSYSFPFTIVGGFIDTQYPLRIFQAQDRRLRSNAEMGTADGLCHGSMRWVAEEIGMDRLIFD